jgi:hypothetical protein
MTKTPCLLPFSASRRLCSPSVQLPYSKITTLQFRMHCPSGRRLCKYSLSRMLIYNFGYK